MTWIVGTSTPFGYAALISDTRVTWASGGHADVLQKIYPIAPNIMVGFAGSVTLGFRALRHLSRLIKSDRSDQDHGRPRRSIMPQWQGLLQEMFDGDKDEAAHGCQLISAGLEVRNGAPSGSYCFTMAGPTFEIESAPAGEWNSIGSGTTYEHARLVVNKRFHDFVNNLMQGEIAMRHQGPGGYAWSVAGALAHSLYNNSAADVSDLLQVGLVRADRCSIHNRQSTYAYGTEDQDERKTPSDLCISLEMLAERARELKASASAAIATSMPRRR